MVLICAATSGNNLKLANKLSQIATSLEIENTVIDLAELDLPLYSPQAEAKGVPEKIMQLSEQMLEAKGFVFCAPEYNGSIPPVLTNTIAWLSVSSSNFRLLFNYKPVVIGTHSGGAGQKVLVAMRLQFSHLGCNVLGREVATNRNKAFNPKSGLVILTQLKRLL